MTIKELQLPLSDYKIGKIGQFYTKEEVDQLIKYAVNEAKRIDKEAMRKHNREATMISMALGFTTLALFVDGLLRLLGIIPNNLKRPSTKRASVVNPRAILIMVASLLCLRIDSSSIRLASFTAYLIN